MAKKNHKGSGPSAGRRNPRGAGRKPKTSESASKRTADLLASRNASERCRKELLSILSELFCQGRTRAEIQKAIAVRYTGYEDLLRGENFWDLLREAAREGLLTHAPFDDVKLARSLEDRYRWLDGRVSVAATGATEALAQRAAEKLLMMIRHVRRLTGRSEVHVGFAGGMTLRTVAERLARLLGEAHEDNPQSLVFHAMVASFDDDDFYADPNSFITYFVNRDCRVDVRLVRLPLPGIVEEDRYTDLRSLAGVKRVFDRRDEIQIIVTSGSLWRDKQSTLRAYLKAAAVEPYAKTDSHGAAEARIDAITAEFDSRGVVGDLLWQPINREGPVGIASWDYRVATLMDLDDLPAFINRGGTVLLVMGCSGISGQPKSELLRTILDLRDRHRWVTDVVTDTPTVAGMFTSGAATAPVTL